MKKLILLLVFLPCLAIAGEPSPVAKQEIAHLISFLKESSCQFNRNGSWYGSTEAADHLNKKYQYLLNKGLVSSAEEFINRGASESSMSSKPYLVRCAGGVSVHSASWLTSELIKYRSARK